MPSVPLQYGDFDYYTSTATDIEALIDLTAPLVGVGSLLVRNKIASPGGQVALNFAPKVATGFGGVLTGRLRAVVRDGRQSASQSFGLLCLQSQRNCTTTGLAYGIRWRGSGCILDLIKVSNGINAAGGTTILATATMTPTPTQGAMAVAWSQGSEALGGFALLGYFGRQLDFSDLTQVLTYQEAGLTLVPPVAEGGYYFNGGSGFAFQIRFDHMVFEQEA